MTSLIDNLLRAGLVQFGHFEDGAPVKLNLELLPSYPRILHKIALDALPELKNVEFDRLVSTIDALPFGLATSIEAGIPLVYSRGSNAAGVHDLVGAYDVGHPAVLVVNTWDVHPGAFELIEKARRVGLEIDQVLAIVNCEPGPSDRLSVKSLLNLSDTVAQLADEGEIPAGQAEAVQRWLNRVPKSSHHRSG